MQFERAAWRVFGALLLAPELAGLLRAVKGDSQWQSDPHSYQAFSGYARSVRALLDDILM